LDLSCFFIVFTPPREEKRREQVMIALSGTGAIGSSPEGRNTSAHTHLWPGCPWNYSSRATRDSITHVSARILSPAY
jgi:hypothetical protein